jgi:ion channel POLLUX/CASTOR
MPAPEPPSPSLADRLRYAFDNSIARGTVALIGWLGAVTLVFLVVATAVVWATGIAPVEDETPRGFVELFWFSLMRTLDAGTMGGDSGSWPFLLAMLGVTLGGIFIVSTLIGTITSGIESRVEALRKGRSKVVERAHSVILGWSPHVFTIVSELTIANENKPGSVIVVLGEADKVEMEDAIRERIPDTRGARVVCRSGTPLDLTDLDMVSVQTARSIVVLAPETDDPDAHVIKAILAITNGPNRRKEPYHIVAEIHDPANMEAARMVGRNEVELVLVGDLISRVTVQTCRQNGLSVVHTELLDFGGDEIYFKHEPALVGKTFAQALFAYEDSALIGLRTGDGSIRLNPPMDTPIGQGDQLIAVSEDDDTIRLSGMTSFEIDESAIRTHALEAPKPERTLILGWNWRAPRIVSGLDDYVAPGSEIVVVSDSPDADAELARECAALKNQKVSHRAGDTSARRVLEDLAIGSFDHVILLCSDRVDVQKADSRVLITLLHLRDMGEKRGRDFSIVSEMLDVRNRELAEVTKVDDFIVSDRLVSLMLAQIAENKELNAVFADLFSADGSEIYVKPATSYVEPGKPVTFYTVLEAARRRNEIALGYKLQAQASNAGKSYGIVVNPDKSAKITFAENDRVIVVAES